MTTRFWTRAWAAQMDRGWGVFLDGRPLRLPSGVSLATPSPALAEAIGAEWQAAGQGIGGVFSAEDVPLTGLAGAAQDCVGMRRSATVDNLATYANADLLCYHVDTPAALAARQQAAWQPWLRWAERTYGAVLGTTTAIVHLAQPPESIAALRAALEGLSNAHLTALGLAIPALGSCILGLALATHAIEGALAADCALLDETYQHSRWGADGAATARLAAIRSDVALAERFIFLAEVIEADVAIAAHGGS